MLHNPPLLTIHRGYRRPEQALLEAFRGAQTSHLCDAMDGRGALDYRIKPLDPDNAVFAGSALTAFAYPADSVGMFGALAEAAPGDVLVVACDGFAGTAVIGDLAAGMMKNKGCAAFVTDGLARDRAGILASGLPVYTKPFNKCAAPGALWYQKEACRLGIVWTTSQLLKVRTCYPIDVRSTRLPVNDHRLNSLARCYRWLRWALP